jgi:hypothetical protein
MSAQLFISANRCIGTSTILPRSSRKTIPKQRFAFSKMLKQHSTRSLKCQELVPHISCAGRSFKIYGAFLSTDSRTISSFIRALLEPLKSFAFCTVLETLRPFCGVHRSPQSTWNTPSWI